MENESMDSFLQDASPWMLRMVLDPAKKQDKGIRNSEIADQINENWEDLKCLFSNDNAEEQVLQIRLMSEKYREKVKKTVIPCFKLCESHIFLRNQIFFQGSWWLELFMLVFAKS